MLKISRKEIKAIFKKLKRGDTTKIASSLNMNRRTVSNYINGNSKNIDTTITIAEVATKIINSREAATKKLKAALTKTA